MGYKTSDGIIIDKCLEKVRPGEWFFVFRGQDLLGTIFVKGWLAIVKTLGICSDEKISECEHCIGMMERTKGRKLPD